MVVIILAAMVPAAAKSPAESYDDLIRKADSAYFAGDCQTACRAFRKAFRKCGYAEPQHLYNAASVAACAGRPNRAIGWLYERMECDEGWYSEQLTTDRNLRALHGHSRWQPLADTMLARQARVEAHFDMPLRRELQRIFNSDQAIRHEYLQALNQGASQHVKDSLICQMQRIDKENTAAVERLLDEHGWVGRNRVGNACVAVWAVVQHADIAVQERLLPVLSDAAAAGDIAPALIAMLEDRINIHSGRPQRYGSQIIGEEGNWRVAPLEDSLRVDEWRREVGLPPMAEYVRQWSIVWE